MWFITIIIANTPQILAVKGWVYSIRTEEIKPSLATITWSTEATYAANMRCDFSGKKDPLVIYISLPS